MKTLLHHLTAAALLAGACLNPASAQTPPTLHLSSGGDFGERFGGSTMLVIIVRTGDPLPAVGVDLAFTPGGGPAGSRAATPGVDYVAADQRVELAGGELSRQITVTIPDDGEVEGLEYFTARLSKPSPGAALTVCQTDHNAPPCSELPFGIYDNEIPAALDVARLGVPEPLICLGLTGEGLEPTAVRVPLRQGGKLLVGDFTMVNGIERPGLARLNVAGELDESFAPSPGFHAPNLLFVNRPIREARDSTLLVIDGSGRLHRLLVDGSMDRSFTPPYTNEFTAIAEADDGSLWAGRSNTVLHLNADGALIANVPLTNLPPPTDSSLSGIVGLLSDGRGYAVFKEQPDADFVLRQWLPDGSMNPRFEPIPWVWRRGKLLDDGRLIARERSRYVSGDGNELVLYDRDGVQASDSFGTDFIWNCDGGSPFALLDDGNLLLEGPCLLGINGVPRSGAGGPLIVDPAGHRRPKLQLSTRAGNGWGIPGYIMPNRDVPQTDFIVVFTRLGDTPHPATVRWTTRDESARAGAHYVAQSGTLNFAPFEVEKSVIIPTLEPGPGTTSFEVVVTSAEGFEALPAPMRLWIRDERDERIFPLLTKARRLRDGRVLIGGHFFTDLDTRLEHSTDLKAWHPVTNQQFGRGIDRRPVWLDPSATNAPTRYYRAVAP